MVVEETISIRQGDIIRVSFEVPIEFNPNSFTNVLQSTGLNLELHLEIGEPTIFRQWRDPIAIALAVLTLGYLIYQGFKHGKVEEDTDNRLRD